MVSYRHRLRQRLVCLMCSLRLQVFAVHVFAASATHRSFPQRYLDQRTKISTTLPYLDKALLYTGDNATSLGGELRLFAPFAPPGVPPVADIQPVEGRCSNPMRKKGHGLHQVIRWHGGKCNRIYWVGSGGVACNASRAIPSRPSTTLTAPTLHLPPPKLSPTIHFSPFLFLGWFSSFRITEFHTRWLSLGRGTKATMARGSEPPTDSSSRALHPVLFSVHTHRVPMVNSAVQCKNGTP